jgi:NADH dehydrogenase FAD-containing subunit
VKRIVILGGGFAGVYAARWLEKLLGRAKVTSAWSTARTISFSSRCYWK